MQTLYLTSQLRYFVGRCASTRREATHEQPEKEHSESRRSLLPKAQSPGSKLSARVKIAMPLQRIQPLIKAGPHRHARLFLAQKSQLIPKRAKLLGFRPQFGVLAQLRLKQILLRGRELS